MPDRSVAIPVASLLGGLIYAIMGLYALYYYRIWDFGEPASGTAYLWGPIVIVSSALIVVGAVLQHSGDARKMRWGSLIVIIFAIVAFAPTEGGALIGFILCAAGAIFGFIQKPRMALPGSLPQTA